MKNSKSKVKRKLLSIVTLGIVLFYNNLQAQSLLNLKEVSITIIPSQKNGDFVGNYIVKINDTLNIQQLEFNLGTEIDSANLVHSIIDFDNLNSIPSGYFYTRNGNTINFSTINFRKRFTYFGSVRIKNNYGIWENPIQFVAN